MPNPERVGTLLAYCLFRQEEIGGDRKPIGGIEPIVVNGLRLELGLHPRRVEECRDEVKDMLIEFPLEFFKGTGDGMSFLNLCDTKDGRQWTDLHQRMEELVCLGMACGYASFTTDKELWRILPGGMPYVVFDVTDKG